MTTATQLRKTLFRVLDDVAQGQEVEISHKGATLRIVPASRGSRLARLITRDESGLAAGDSGWDAAAQAEWEAEQKELYGA
ncbi:MAG: type II toxin-antitoxin system prevent-host-death family antitoxin [Bryobacteraceae bacterium]|nr:type II toxin-antitoxin system prevent-host-death family antitoxin [Bryobacteraceae bacterium]